MRKSYQNEEIDTSQPTVPDTVSGALGELAVASYELFSQTEVLGRMSYFSPRVTGVGGPPALPA